MEVLILKKTEISTAPCSLRVEIGHYTKPDFWHQGLFRIPRLWKTTDVSGIAGGFM